MTSRHEPPANREEQQPAATNVEQQAVTQVIGSPGGEPFAGSAEEVSPAGSFESDIDLKEYLWLLWARRWLILITTALVAVLSWAWALTRPERYRASSTISIDARAPQIIQRSQLLIGPSPWEQAAYINEQERVLKSYDLAQRAADRIGLDALGAGGANRLLGMLDIDPQPEPSLVTL